MALVEFNNLSDFELAHIFECGQCFRWRKIENEKYIGIIKNGVVEVRRTTPTSICMEYENYVCLDAKKIKEELIEYFDLNTDYSNIKNIISKNDTNMKKAIKYGNGIRILNQNSWEMLISFIISAANNIPRISKTIENISKKYGKEVKFKGEKYYLFPTPEELSKASIEELRALNLGFRDKYVYAATKMVCNKEIDLEKISKMDYLEAKKELKKIPGIGDKVADCILLFSMKKHEAFPVDTWIKKVMSELYNESKDIKKIANFASEKFGENAGIAQQYLFYYMRENY